MAEVLEFKREPDKLCGNQRCIRVVHPRTPGNDPAYCSYACGAEAQPDRIQPTLRNQRAP